MTDKPPFTGKGFSKDEMTPDERSQHRELLHELSDVWTSISALSDMVKGSRALGKIIAAGAVIGGAVAYLVKQGVFG